MGRISRKKSMWARSTVISRYSLLTEHVRKAPDKQSWFMLLTLDSSFLESTRKEKECFPPLCDLLCLGSLGELTRKQIPERPLVLCEPFKVQCGVRDSPEGGDHKPQKFQDLDLKVQARTHRLPVITGRGGKGEGGQDGNSPRNVGQAGSSLNFQRSCSLLCPDQSRRMVPWKTEGHKGP